MRSQWTYRLTHKHRPSTVNLAAHARQGLINESDYFSIVNKPSRLLISLRRGFSTSVLFISHVFVLLLNRQRTGVTVYFIRRIFYPGDSIFYPQTAFIHASIVTSGIYTLSHYGHTRINNSMYILFNAHCTGLRSIDMLPKSPARRKPISLHFSTHTVPCQTSTTSSD